MAKPCSRTELEPLLSPIHSTSGSSLCGRSDALRTANSEHDPLHDDLPASDTENNAKVAATMTCFFITGIQVTAIGALVPTLEDFYRINDSTTASIFPVGVAGYVTASLLMPKVVTRSGWRGVALVSPILHLISALMLSTVPPFLVVLPSYFIAGLGTGLSDSGLCSWSSNRPYANVVLGLMHGSYAVGCVLGPIASLAVLEQGFNWFVFYRMMIISSCVELVALSVAFRKDTLSTYQMSPKQHDQPKKEGFPRAKLVLMCSIFYFLDIAIESSYTSWIITYMQRVRDVKIATASLSSSVFWIGMALGRAILGIVTQHFGLGISVATYITMSACLQVLFRLTHNVPASLLLLGATGFFLSPMFPSGIRLLASRLPLHEAVDAIAAAAAIGQVGGATAPLAIGFMADRLGMNHLPDVISSLSLLLLFVWLIFSRCR